MQLGAFRSARYTCLKGEVSPMRLIIAATALLAAVSASAQGAAPLVPTAKWVVDFDEAQCVAMRNYGTESKPLLFVLKQPAAGEIMQVAVLRKGVRSSKYADQVDGWVRIDNGTAIASSMIKFHVKERGERVLMTNMPLAQFAAVRKAQSLSIAAPLEFNGTFQLGSMGPLMNVMDSCVADLRKVWNAGTGSLKKSSAGNLQGLIRADDYPGIAITKMKSGTVSFIVLVNEQGRVADCSVVETSGVAALDAQSCAVVTERARFQPAIGMDGKPAKSTFKQRITWRLK